MAFTNGLSERMGELRFPNPKSPTDDAPFSAYVSPPRGQSSFFSPFQPSPTDSRGNLQRRFTTDSSKMSSLSSMGGQNSQLVKSQLTASVCGAHFIFPTIDSQLCGFSRCQSLKKRSLFGVRLQSLLRRNPRLIMTSNNKQDCSHVKSLIPYTKLKLVLHFSRQN